MIISDFITSLGTMSDLCMYAADTSLTHVAKCFATAGLVSRGKNGAIIPGNTVNNK